MDGQIERSEALMRRYARQRSLWREDGKVLELAELRYGLLWRRVHEELAEEGGDRAEEEIRRLLRTVLEVDLRVCEKKIGEMRDRRYKTDEVYGWLKRWLALYEGWYALVAYRSLEYYANYMEWDKRDADKVWKYSVDPRGDGGYTGVNFPFFFYFNQMVLKKNIRFISKQQPTGTGKSFGNTMAITWALGINPDNDFLVVLGNPALVLTNTRGIVETMCNPKYAKVFPKFAKYHGMEGEIRNNIFSVCRQKEGELTLDLSNKALNVKVISKETPVDGIRVRYLFLDDVCRSKDAENNRAHEQDVANYWNSWWKRNYGTDDFYVVVGGTAYSIYDILSSLKAYYSKGKVKRSTVNKYTTLSMDGRCAFICIPALDYDTDESTYPQKFPTEEKKAIRQRDFRMFMAMEQQSPLPPETSPFYWEKIMTYDVIPEQRSAYCWATIDPVRVGGDNFAMPIFVQAGDYFYLKDCIYQNVEPEMLYQLVVDKIKQHNITQLVIERNTDTSLKKLLEGMLKAQGVTFCNIQEIYTYEKKDIRITNQQNTIKTRIIFPAEYLYGRSSEMGRFMYDIVSFSWDLSKNAHDDSIDAVTMFCETLLKGKAKNFGTVSTFRR